MQTDFASWVEAHREDVLAFLKEIVEINSFTRNPEGANRVGDVLSGFLDGIGFAEKRYPNEHFGDHQVFTRSGSGSRLLFLTHKDTVFPPDAGFTQFRIEGDRAMGPGVIDMKGGIVVLLFALRMLHEMGLGGSNDYAITVVSDEEIGSDDSRALTEELARDRDYVLVFECGGRQGELVTSRKGVGTYFVEIEGRAAHAGNEYMDGINANLELAHKLIAIQGLTDVEKGTTVKRGRDQRRNHCEHDLAFGQDGHRPQVRRTRRGSPDRGGSCRDCRAGLGCRVALHAQRVRAEARHAGDRAHEAVSGDRAGGRGVRGADC